MKTTIEYTDEVSNPLFARPIGDESVKIGTFCEKPDAEGTCKNCWAETLNLRFGNKLTFDKANRSKIEWVYKDKPMQRLRSLNADKRESERNPGHPLMVFCCDTFDLFQPSIPLDLVNKIFDQYDKFSNLIIQIQTTYPAKMSSYLNARYGSDIPSHYWFGMSAGTQDWLEKYLKYLFSIRSKVRYLIFEPLLQEINVGRAVNKYYENLPLSKPVDYQKIEWIVVGGESGNNARQCSAAWIRSLINYQSDIQKEAILIKQYGTFLSKLLGFKSSKGKDMSEWADDLKIRQFPI